MEAWKKRFTFFRNILWVSSEAVCKAKKSNGTRLEEWQEKLKQNVVDGYFRWCNWKNGAFAHSLTCSCAWQFSKCALKFSCKLCNVNYVNLYFSLDWRPCKRWWDSAEQIIRDWQGRCSEANREQWEAYCTKSGYESENVSLFSGERLVAKPASKTSKKTIVSIWVPLSMIAESSPFTIVTCGQQHLTIFAIQSFGG